MARSKKATPAPETCQLALTSTAAESDPASAIITTTRVRPIQQWRVDALKPNPHNARLFPDSLGDSSITLLAEDMDHRGQDVPVRVTPSAVIVDGERRVRAAKKLGWEEIDVVVGPELTDAEMLDHVISACTSARQISIREQANIYVAVTEQLKRTAGRAQGRPKTKPIGDLFLSTKQIQEVAAAKARFDSARSAERAKAVFARGSDELQDQVSRGELSIGAGYDLVPKRPPRLKAAEDENRNDASPGEKPEVGPLNGGAAVPLTKRAPDTDAGPIEADEAGAPPPVQGEQQSDDQQGSEQSEEDDDSDPPNDADDKQADNHLQSEQWGDGEELDESESPPGAHREHNRAQGRDTKGSPSPAKRWKPEAQGLGRRLGTLISMAADHDYEEARAVVEEIVADLWTSLGEPPQDSDEPDRDADDDDDQDQDNEENREDPDLEKLAEMLAGV